MGDRDPERFHRAERARREEAGFPVGAPVFRVEASEEAVAGIRSLDPPLLLESGGTPRVCLVALRPETLSGFADSMRRLARDGDVLRVDAEPHR